MRKVAGTRVALALGLVAFTACQSADRSPVGSTATEPGQDQAGTARAAVDPIPVPGKPVPVPVPGRGGSTTKIPVPGSPTKGPAPGSPATPPPTGPGTPGATPTPIPGTVTRSFQSTDTPVDSSTGTFPRILSEINVSGITGQVVSIVVAFRATIPDNVAVDNIRLFNPISAPDQAGATFFSDSFSPKLAGSDIGSGTNCTPGAGAATFDDRPGAAGGEMSQDAPPYSGVFVSEFGTLGALAALTRTPAHANGDWLLQFDFETGAAPATLECWQITFEYRPS
jgi:hypothetical protein